MTEEESLAKAYLEFSLEAGSSIEEINAAYKDLVMVWHSDRFPSGSKKQKADEKMKKINNARDLLRKHFAEDHKKTGYCACRPKASTGKAQEQSTGGGFGAGPGKSTAQQNAEDEAQARKRNEERARQAAQEAAAAKAKQAAQAAEASRAQFAAQTAMEQQKLANDERLRWRISVIMVVAWLGLNLFGMVSMNAKSWWHDFSWKWDRDHPSTPPATQSETPSTTPGYIPAYNKFPGGDQNTWQQQQDADQKRRDEQAERQKKQDIYV